jgi:DNA-binding MarR family transcriptional regulator
LASNYNHNYYDTTRGNNLNHWEFLILNAIRRESRTENKISKLVKLNESIVSEIITSLIEKGFVIGIRKRRLFFFHAKYFSTTLDGLTALEIIKENQDRTSNNAFWKHIVGMIGGGGGGGYRDYQ